MKYIKITEQPTIKTSELLADCRKLFTIYSYFDDAKLDKDFPPPKKATVRYFQDCQEGDEELKNISANDLKEKGIEGITLRERLLFELGYFKKTGKHLDIQNITLCSGSRCSDGSVPSVDWSGYYDGLRVHWFYADGRYAYLRSRQPVSKPSDSSLVPLDLPNELVINGTTYLRK